MESERERMSEWVSEYVSEIIYMTFGHTHTRWQLLTQKFDIWLFHFAVLLFFNFNRWRKKNWNKKNFIRKIPKKKLYFELQAPSKKFGQKQKSSMKKINLPILSQNNLMEKNLLKIHYYTDILFFLILGLVIFFVFSSFFC